jgi:hypothetical protein
MQAAHCNIFQVDLLPAREMVVDLRWQKAVFWKDLDEKLSLLSGIAALLSPLDPRVNCLSQEGALMDSNRARLASHQTVGCSNINHGAVHKFSAPPYLAVTTSLLSALVSGG